MPQLPKNVAICLGGPLKKNKKQYKWELRAIYFPGHVTITRWWQLKHFLFSPRTLGKMNPIWRIFFRWVGSTTNQVRSCCSNGPFVEAFFEDGDALRARVGVAEEERGHVGKSWLERPSIHYPYPYHVYGLFTVHLVEYNGKCRWIYHTWMVWVINARVFLKKSEKTIILDFLFGTLRLIPLNIAKRGDCCGSFFGTTGDAQTIISYLQIAESWGEKTEMLRHLPIPQAVSDLSLLELSDVSGSAVSLVHTLPWLPDSIGFSYGFTTAALQYGLPGIARIRLFDAECTLLWKVWLCISSVLGSPNHLDLFWDPMIFRDGFIISNSRGHVYFCGLWLTGYTRFLPIWETKRQTELNIYALFK